MQKIHVWKKDLVGMLEPNDIIEKDKKPIWIKKDDKIVLEHPHDEIPDEIPDIVLPTPTVTPIDNYQNVTPDDVLPAHLDYDPDWNPFEPSPDEIPDEIPDIDLSS